MLRVSCIIPSLLGKKTVIHLKKCISTIRASARNNIVLKIYVVTENRITGKSKFRLTYDKLIIADVGSGFSGMVNLSVEKAILESNPDYLMIINDDAYISKDFFKIFIKNVIKSKPDVVIPLVYRISGGIDSFGAEYFSSGFARNTSDLKTFTTIAPANCVLYKTNLFQKLKKRFGFIFNPVLGFYFEDVEISIRAHSIGAKFTKSEKLIAFHIGSLSAVKHSYFRTFYSYRNVVWLIIINWPLNSVIKYFKNIFLVQSYAFLKSTIYFGPILYMKILWSTIRNIKTLIYYRKTTQKGYLKDFNFEGLLNRHMYKRKNGRYI